MKTDKYFRPTQLLKLISFATMVWFEAFIYAQTSDASIPSIQINATDSFKINGKVFDINGRPVRDVMISFEGIKSAPIFTDSLGLFETKIPTKNGWMILSPIGNFQKKRLYINNTSNVEVYLSPNSLASGSDPIFTGFREKSKRDINGSFVSVDVSNYESTNGLTLEQYLQGKVAGLMVTNNSGVPASGAYMSLRGVKSLFANNQPLYVIDGIPFENANIFTPLIEGYNFSPLANIDPHNITNITVFKDAVANAMYGVKGSNGVVVIETLKPNELKTTIDVSIKTGYYEAPKQLPLLNSEEFRSLGYELLSSSYIVEENYPILFPGLYDNKNDDSYYRYHNSKGVLNNTNWQDKIFENALFNEAALTIKGGDDIAKYGLAVGLLQHDANLKNTDYSRANIRFVGEFNMYEWLKLFTTSNLNFSNASLMDNGSSISSSPILSALTKTPLLNPTLRDRQTGLDLPSFFEDYDNFGVSNPVAIVNGFQGLLNTYRLISSTKMEAKISKNLVASALFGINFFSSRERVFKPNIGTVPYYDGDIWNVAQNMTNTYRNYYTDINLRYDKMFQSHSKLSLIGGYRLQMNRLEQDFSSGKNLPINDQYTSVSRGDRSLSEIGGDNGVWNWASIYGNAQYALHDKYFVNGSLSVDGSSRVGSNANTGVNVAGQPFGVFPAIGLAWRVSNEDFMKNIGWIEDFKIRGSYGLTGNDDIGNYNSYNYYVPLTYRKTTGLVAGSRPNTNLKYETSFQSNIGVDLSFLGDRISFAFDYFNTITKDMMLLEKQESYLGYDFRPTNGGEALNRGYEAALSARAVNTKNISWDIAFNVASYKNEVLAIKGGTLVNGIFISRVGDELNSFYGYVAEGVYSTTAQAKAAGLVNDRFMPYQAGDVKFRNLYNDANNQNVIDSKDKTVLGSPNPDFFGGFTNHFRYKKWSANAFVQFAIGQEIFNQVRSITESMATLDNQSKATLNRFVYEGQQTQMPRALLNDPIGNSQFSSRWIEDGSYVRLKNLTVAYTLSNGVKLNKNSEKNLFRSVQIYATATNLLTFTKYLGYDPEFSYGPDIFNQGIDLGQMPQVKSFMLGVKVGL